MNASDTLLHLRDIATQIRDFSDLLNSGSADLGEENVGFVLSTAAELEGTLNLLSSSAQDPDPLDSRELRHDLRNKVGVIKGFSDLMQMDLTPGSPWARTLSRLIELSDKFVELLNQAKERTGADFGAAIFA